MTKRIYVPVTDEDHQKIIDMAVDEQRDKAPMAAILLREGLKQREQPEPVLSYQQRIVDGLVKKKDNG